MESQLNKRQDFILSVLERRGTAPVREIVAELSTSFPTVSEITVKRDMAKLLVVGLATKSGKGRATTYTLSPRYTLLRPIDPEAYFKIEADQRAIKERFDFRVFQALDSIFTKNEKDFLDNLNELHRKNIKKMSHENLEKEYERLVIELSWKSSHIEGNTYSLLETESLIRQHEEAEGHKKEEATMILNHKKALDYVRDDPEFFKKISIPKIEDIHSLLIEGLGVPKGLRKSAVGIVGTKYRPLDNAHEIREAMEKMCDTINKEPDPFSKSLLVSILIAYIQPFEDGNKRTSRILGNALLMANNSCPLSYRSASETEYKKAVILFYEQNNIVYYKKLFIQQFEFAIGNYFLL